MSNTKAELTEAPCGIERTPRRRQEEDARQRKDLSTAWQKLTKWYDTVEISQRRKTLIFGKNTDVARKTKSQDLPPPWMVMTEDEIKEAEKKSGSRAAVSPQKTTRRRLSPKSARRILWRMRAAPSGQPRAAPRGFEVGTREEQRFHLFRDPDGRCRFLAWTTSTSESQPV